AARRGAEGSHVPERRAEAGGTGAVRGALDVTRRGRRWRGAPEPEGLGGGRLAEAARAGRRGGARVPRVGDAHGVDGARRVGAAGVEAAVVEATAGPAVAVLRARIQRLACAAGRAPEIARQAAHVPPAGRRDRADELPVRVAVAGAAASARATGWARGAEVGGVEAEVRPGTVGV